MNEEITNLAIEILFIICAFGNAALFVPQILLLYKTKNGQSISLLMFIGFLIIQLATALRGLSTGDTILMLGYILSFISCSIVVILILFYRRQN